METLKETIRRCCADGIYPIRVEEHHLPSITLEDICALANIIGMIPGEGLTGCIHTEDLPVVLSKDVRRILDLDLRYRSYYCIFLSSGHNAIVLAMLKTFAQRRSIYPTSMLDLDDKPVPMDWNLFVELDKWVQSPNWYVHQLWIMLSKRPCHTIINEYISRGEDSHADMLEQLEAAYPMPDFGPDEDHLKYKYILTNRMIDCSTYLKIKEDIENRGLVINPEYNPNLFRNYMLG